MVFDLRIGEERLYHISYLDIFDLKTVVGEGGGGGGGVVVSRQFINYLVLNDPVGYGTLKFSFIMLT